MSNARDLDLTGYDKYVPSDGSSHRRDLLTHNGAFMCRVEAVTPVAGSGDKNDMVVVDLTVLDADNAGKGMTTNVVYTGEYNSKTGPKPNKERLFSLLASAGISAADIAGAVAQGKAQIAAIADKLVGRTVYTRTEAKPYDKTGRWSSEPGFFFSTKTWYEGEIKSPRARQSLPPAALAQLNGAVSAPANGIGTATAETAPALEGVI